MTLVANRPRAWLWLTFVFLLAGCAGEPDAERLSGQIFGTTWSLTYVPSDPAPDPRAVEEALTTAFDIVNAQMNHYDPESTLSAFNALPPGQSMEVGWDFAYVLGEALQIGELTDGAYDVTVSPAVNLWGFGPDGPSTTPSDTAIAVALAKIGPGQLIWDSRDRMLAKRRDGVALDFSSIAKGYGVDLGADALDDLGIERYMLEVGGELRLRGLSPRGDPWRIAIEKPTSAIRAVQAALQVTDIGMATSGDYRNFFELDGQRYSHLIDPRTGRPIVHDLVSVTVLHPSTAIADAWATAFIVLGYDRARELANEFGWPVYFVRRVGEEIRVEWTPSMTAFVTNPSGS